MEAPVTMPQLGESVTEGTVTRWLKHVGEYVEADEPLLEVSTDKVDTEIPAPAAGILRSILVQEDETVATGTELATIAAGDPAAVPPAASPREPALAAPPRLPAPHPSTAASSTAASSPAASSPARSATAAVPAPEPVVPEPARTSPPHRGRAGSGAYVTPLVRRLAAEHGVVLATLRPARRGDRIRREDVLEAARLLRHPLKEPTSPPAAAPDLAAERMVPPADDARGRTVEMSPARRTLAARLTESLRTSAHLATVVEADVTEVVRLCEAAAASFRAREGAELTLGSFVALAALDAVKAYPIIGARVDQDRGVILHPDRQHLAITVDTPGGPVSPVIRDAGDRNLAGLARAMADLGERARDGRLAPRELSGGTFTLEDRSGAGVLFFTTIIAQPQVAVLGIGAVARRPAAVAHPALGEVVAVRSMLHLALNYDHRLIDGADAARFLELVRKRLETGDFAVGSHI